MRKFSLLILFVAFSVTVSFGQLIESYDNLLDSTYQVSGEQTNRIDISLSADHQEGTGALLMKPFLGAYHPWGTFAQIIKRIPEGAPEMDWTINDTLSIWLKVVTPPTHPEYMVFRIHIADRPTASDPVEEYIYEHATILDASSGWVNLKIPLFERWTDGSVVPNDSGFVVAPNNWGGFTYNNRRLDYNKIIGFNIGFITSGWTDPANIPADSMEVIVDGLTRTGTRSIPAIIFNGVAIPSNLGNPWAWGQSSISVEVGGGPGGAAPNALKWIQGNEWNNGWTGFGFDVTPGFNLAGAWVQDSLKFQYKAETGVGPIRAQFETATAKVGKVFTPIADGQWHEYALRLSEFTPQDNTTGFDSSNVTKFGFMAEASAIAGKVVYFTNVWTGNPVFDVLPPVAPTNVTVNAGTYINTITWSDVPNETNEKYHIYYSTSPITDVTAPGVEVVKMNIAGGVNLFDHMLIAPATDQAVTYYYAISCTDDAGNNGPLSDNSAAITNTAKGYATISKTAPTSFVADGNLQEFLFITPQVMKSSDGSGYIVTNTTITGDADLSAKSYVAFDNDYLYVGMDITDDIVTFVPGNTTYLNDCPDLFIGLYNAHGAPHSGLQRGAEPDYHFRFAKDRLMIDGGKDSILIPGTNYFWGEQFPSGYVVEAKISLSDLAALTGDNRFYPVEGMRLPLDYAINDADGANREGILTYSPYNEDLSYQTVSRWLYTWIGNAWNPVGVNEELTKSYTYALSQNYPNPFNPATRIQYSLKNDGVTSIKVYDVVGREVATVLNEFQNAGTHEINFNASKLTSGVYFYKIVSGSYSEVKKMVLLK
ncbi:MAG TPA: T9SS type A sorting domain-containing protein [Ignavibacteriaceae bacterium]|nr:T9SS type A sorting domain-containing protein [Ignavibacteriaceae bacterium]